MRRMGYVSDVASSARASDRHFLCDREKNWNTRKSVAKNAEFNENFFTRKSIKTLIFHCVFIVIHRVKTKIEHEEEKKSSAPRDQFLTGINTF